MHWFRQTLQRHGVSFLILLVTNVFFMMAGSTALYAHELKQLEQDRFAQQLAVSFGLPVEALVQDGSSDETAIQAETVIDELLEELSSAMWWSSDVRQHAAPSSSSAGSKLSTNSLRSTPTPSTEGQGALVSRSTQGPNPLVRLERKARTVAGSASSPSAKSSGRASPSTPRRVIPKSGIAPEIIALASSLSNSPARIFRFVHDTIGFDPKWGASKSPLGTLREQLGTSWDQTWLLLELLTAAGVDARIEWGEVEIPTNLMLQIAGVSDPFRAGDLLTTAGMPIVLVVEGSQVVHARMSHVWVKAFLDYIPRRGVAAGPGDTWIRMDPSLKRFDTNEGVRLDEAVPYDLGEYLQSGTESSPRQVYDEAIETHIVAQNLGVTLEEMKPAKAIVEEAFPFVPGTLRGKILSVTNESTTVPSSFQQRLEVQVREDGGTTLLTWSAPWPSLYGKRLEIAWPGATAADQATLDLHGGVFVAPPYEVDLKPVIRLDGIDVAIGGAMGSAEDVTMVATLSPPSGPATAVPFAMRAGEHAVLSLDFGRIPQETIDRFANEQGNATEAAEIEAWGLAQSAAEYLRAVSTDVEHLAALRGLRRVQLGNVALAIQRGAVSIAPDGTPLSFSAAPPAVDLGSMILGLFPASGDSATTAASIATLELIGSHASYLEVEALTTALGGEHLSAVTALTQAVREGQTLTRVDAANVDTALAEAELGDDAESSVQAGLPEARLHGFIRVNSSTSPGTQLATSSRTRRPVLPATSSPTSVCSSRSTQRSPSMHRSILTKSPPRPMLSPRSRATTSTVGP